MMVQPRPKHILLVEDYEPVREMTAAVLEDRGYRVSTVIDGATMREVLKKDDTVDAIVLDVLTPGEGGASLAQHAKELGIPVVMISGSPDAMRLAEDQGLQLVRKPFKIGELYAAIDKAFASGKFGQREA
jgi:DNA-binding NtrC family response regulator